MDYFSQHKKLQPNFKVIIPFKDFHSELTRELALHSVEVLYQSDSLFILNELPFKPIWAQDIWSDCVGLEVKSINQGIDVLKKYKNIGSYYPLVKSNFGQIISKQIKNIPLKRIDYQLHHPFDFKFTAWTMLDSFLIISVNTEKRFPFGWHEFNEDKETPPSRAYLKLWEAFTVYNIPIHKEDVVIEVGSSPGGWTWVLSQVCKKVYSIDRAPLAEKISKIKNISHQEKDAFKLKLEEFSDCTWFFSDIICTPESILEAIQFWIKNSSVENFVCTIKFKGDCNYDLLKTFLAIDHSHIVHLYHNKNEVTWIRTKRPFNMNKKVGSNEPR